MTRHIVVHTRLGVFMGSAMAMDFWSNLDPMGGDSAAALPSEVAEELFVDTVNILTWHGLQDLGTFRVLEVVPDRPDGMVSMTVCVAAGAKPWDPETVNPLVVNGWDWLFVPQD